MTDITNMTNPLTQQSRKTQGLPEIKPTLFDLFGSGCDMTPLIMDARVSQLANIRVSVIKKVFDDMVETTSWEKSVVGDIHVYTIDANVFGQKDFDHIVINFWNTSDMELCYARIHCQRKSIQSSFIDDITEKEHRLHQLLRSHWPYLCGQRDSRNMNINH